MCVVECSFWWSVVVFSDFGEDGTCFESRGRLFRQRGGGSKEILLEIRVAVAVAREDSRSSTVKHQRWRFGLSTVGIEIINGKFKLINDGIFETSAVGGESKSDLAFIAEYDGALSQ